MIEIHGSFGRRQVEISGGHTNIKDIEKTIKILEEVDKKNGTISQLFDANKIAGKNHLLHSTKLALESIESGKAFADSPRIELTCWTAGLRQISKSLDRVGIKKGSKKIALATIGNKASTVNKTQSEIFQKIGVESDEKVLEVNSEKIEDLQTAFSISEKQTELFPLEEVVRERIALLSLDQ